MYVQLLAFIDENGHSQPNPHEEPQLTSWLDKQRQELENAPSENERRRKLELMGVLSAPCPDSISRLVPI